MCVVTMLIVFLFSFGSLDHVLSASYHKTNNGWWTNNPLNPSYPEYQLINFLYECSSTTSYDFIGTFYDWNNPSSYVIYPSGMSLLSEPLIDIWSRTNDSKEIYLLKSILPINYLLVPKGTWLTYSFLADAITDIDPIFSNNKYEVYSISQLKLSKTNLLPTSDDFLTAEIVAFEGNLTLVDDLNGRIDLNYIYGEIHPVDEGRVVVHSRYSLNNMTNKITALTPLIIIEGNLTLFNMKSSWEYFKEIR